MLEIRRIDDSEQIVSPVLRERANNCKGGWAQFYLAQVDNEECGLLCYDDLSKDDFGQVHEIFVLEQFRQRGIGNTLLRYAEEIAMKLKCRRIQLQPYALDPSRNTQRLIDWYARKGYLTALNEPGYMEKILSAE